MLDIVSRWRRVELTALGELEFVDALFGLNPRLYTIHTFSRIFVNEWEQCLEWRPDYSRLFEKPIECSRILPVMGYFQEWRWRENGIKWTSTPMNHRHWAVLCNRIVEQREIQCWWVMDEWNGMSTWTWQFVSTTLLWVICHWASLDISISSCPQWDPSLPTFVAFIMKKYCYVIHTGILFRQEQNGLNRSTIAAHSNFSVVVSRNWQWQNNMPATRELSQLCYDLFKCSKGITCGSTWWIWQCPIQCSYNCSQMITS